MSVKKKWIKVTAIILPIVIRFLIQIGIPTFYNSELIDDDMLFVNYAKSILDSGWLGNYSYHTLNKSPGFGLFLAMLKFLDIPYMVGIALLWCASSLFFYYAFKKLTKKGIISYLAFLYILFCPIMFDFSIVQKLYRMSVVPPVALFIISSFICIFADRNEGYKKLLVWSIIAGVFIFIFNIIREDSVWMMCFSIGAIVLVTILIFIKGIKEKPIDIVSILIVALIPFSFVFVGNTTIKMINKHFYGIYTITDFKDTSYADMGKSILSIKPENEIKHVWVTRKTIEKIYEISPTFASIKPALDKKFESMDSWAYGVIDGEIEKDYVMWAIRYSANESGIYGQGAVYANDFYKQVNDDIQTAFDNGIFEKRDAIILSNLARPLNLHNDIKGMNKYFKKSLENILLYKKYKCQFCPSKGREKDINYMAKMTTTYPIIYDNTFNIQGWIFSTENDDIDIVINDTTVEFDPSEDVYNAYNGEYEKTLNCRFNIELNADDFIEIYINNVLVSKCKATEIGNLQIDNVNYFIDKAEYKRDVELYDYYNDNIEISNKVIKIYQSTALPLAVFVMLIYVLDFVFNIVRMIKKQKGTLEYWMIKTGLLLTIALDIAIVTINYFDAYNGNGAMVFYTAGVIPFWMCFVCMNISDFIDYFKLLILKIKRYNDKDETFNG